MKIFVPGASGLVGFAFTEAATAAGHSVVAVQHQGAVDPSRLMQAVQVDLGDAEATRAVIRSACPDVIVNCAAISQPATCETNPAASHALNVALPALLAELATELGSRLIHLSSEQVFSGETDRPYRPEDPVAPRNVYGRHKVESERAVLGAAEQRAVIIRPPLLVGNSRTGSASHHEQILAAWAAGKTPRMFSDEFRQPCSASNLARVLLELCGRPEITGIYHWAGLELVSRYDLLVGFRRRFGLDERSAPIATQTRAAVPDLASIRPRTLPLETGALAGRITTRPETLDRMLATLHAPAAARETMSR